MVWDQHKVSDYTKAASCDGKVKYPNGEKAYAQAKKMRDPAKAYKCHHCGSFHLTRSINVVKRPKQKKLRFIEDDDDI